MSKIMSAVGGISDRHILEFTGARPRVRAPLWLKLGSAAACLALAALAAVMIFNNANEMTPDCCAYPKVIFNDTVYLIAPDYPMELYELPEGYILVGEVTTNDRADDGLNGYSCGCKPGEHIYQNPDSPEDIYVYTKLFSGNRFRYLRFLALDSFGQSSE